MCNVGEKSPSVGGLYFSAKVVRRPAFTDRAVSNDLWATDQLGAIPGEYLRIKVPSSEYLHTDTPKFSTHKLYQATWVIEIFSHASPGA